MKFTEISFSRIKNEVENFLRTEYNKASILFSKASPYGQILSVVENLHQLSLLYLKSSLNQFDLSNASITNTRIVRNAAIFAGHNPSRGISSTGTLLFKLKSDLDIEREIPGSKVQFSNWTELKNKTNSLDYSLDLGTETVTHNITTGYQFRVNIIQGLWKQTTFTGTGQPLQTYFVNVSGLKDVENFHVEVYVNGELWENRMNLYDMGMGEKTVVTKSGFDGGLDIIFGNDGYGSIPELGTPIVVRYLLTDGSSGNIFRRTVNDWTFVGDVLDGRGNSIDIQKVFNIEIYTDINFGADGETTQFTRSLLPMVSNNYILALPSQYAYHIKRLGVFSHVNAYEKNGTVFVSVTPNINLFKNKNSNYFNIDIEAFSLDEYEINKISEYLKISGTIQLTKNFKIVNPILSYYVMNIYVIPYSDAIEDSLNGEIHEVVSNYFLNLNRLNRIPKVDLIKELSNIKDIHSVDIRFISKKNEDYHSEAMNNLRNQMTPDFTSGGSKSIPKPPINYNSSETKGLDPILGDIIFSPDELPVIRGGWRDRNGNFYNSDINSGGLKSINIINTGYVDKKNKPK